MILIALLIIGAALWELVRGPAPASAGNDAGIQDGSSPRDWLRILGGLVTGGGVLAVTWSGEFADNAAFSANLLLVALAALVEGVRALRSGHALDPMFSREHEPHQFWVLTVGASMFSALLIAFAISVLWPS